MHENTMMLYLCESIPRQIADANLFEIGKVVGSIIGRVAESLISQILPKVLLN